MGADAASFVLSIKILVFACLAEGHVIAERDSEDIEATTGDKNPPPITGHRRPDLVNGCVELAFHNGTVCNKNLKSQVRARGCQCTYPFGKLERRRKSGTRLDGSRPSMPASYDSPIKDALTPIINIRTLVRIGA